MNKIITVILATVLLSSCGEFFPSDGRFYIKNVQPYKKGVYQYQLISVIGKNGFWLKDSANKYIVGDTVIITPLHQTKPHQ